MRLSPKHLSHARSILTVAAISFLSANISFAQPNRGDLEIYETAIGANTGNANTIQPNLLFIADTSGSMNSYVAVEYDLTKDAYDPTFDYGGDGSAADDSYIYVYNDLETFSGVTITPAQNKCDALTTAHTGSPNFPLFTDKVLQWKPINSVVEITPEVVCETTSASSSSTNVPSQSVSNNWDQLSNSPRVYESDVISGTTVTLEMSNTGSRRAKGGVSAEEMTAGGSYTGDYIWLCYKNRWSDGSTSSCSGDVDDIPFTYYELQVWMNGKNGSTTMNGTLTYNEGAPEVQVDPGCVAADAVTAEVVSDGEWSGSLETNSDSAYILECEEDAGVHGVNNSSTDVEAAFCGAASCVNPRYVASGGIDWASEGLVDKYFYTGNYHDYLEYTPPVPGTLYDTRAGWDVRRRNNHSDWDSASSRGVESFCNLFKTYDRVASDRNDSGTWSPVIPHPIVAPDDIFLQDSSDGTNFVYICRQKQQTMINALTDMATSISGVNMGLMRFNSSGSGGTVISHVQNINGSTERTALVNKIAALPASGGTPLGETMSEAYRYFNGGNKYFSESNADADAFTGTINASPYESPITQSCQSNNIIYLTDGEPSVDSSSNGIAPGGCSGNCLDEWADYMASNDIHSIDGNNTVTTYTVGFAIDFPLLASTAEKGDGEYFTAENYDDLMTAFQEILLNIAISEPSTLVAPAVSVNAFNELKHRSQIYYATFTPSFNPAWEGNVKRYAITGEGIVYGQGGPNAPVIGDDGFFKSSAQSFWSDFPDGAMVEQGGYREQLDNTRNIYLESSVITGGGSGIIPLTGSSNLTLAPFGAADATEANEIRDWMLGIDVDDYDEDLSFIDAHKYASDSLHSKPFVVTYSGTNESNAVDILFVSTNMGALRAIDARSTAGTELWSYIPDELVGNVKTYKDNSAAFRHWNAYGLDGEATVWAEEAAGSTPAAFNIGNVYMYQGMRRGGDTYYAWDISNADVGLNGPGSDGSKPPIANLWQINGGVAGGPATTSGFSDLGYTWSKMVRSKIRYGCSEVATNTGCTEKDVLVFSGGYDGYYDTEANAPKTSNTGNSILGRAVYIVDAMTGALLWSTGSSNSSDTHALQLPIYNSIPGDPSPLDVDGDGDLDMLFFTDISGAVFRVDFDQSKSLGSTYATGGMIANLRENSVFRRFYNGVDVSLIAPIGETSYLAVSVGSGYRAHPKEEETWTNRFYVLVDENINSPELYGANDDSIAEDTITYSYVKTRGEDAEGNEITTARAVITPSVLHAFTSADPYNKGRLATGESEPDGEHGFYRNLDGVNYEKILQSSVTFGGDILVGSYLPIGNAAAATCGSGQIGTGRVYKFSIETGTSTFDTDEDGDIDANDADYITLDHEGIPPDPTILLVPELVTCIGTECSDDWLDLETGQAERTYWREQ